MDSKQTQKVTIDELAGMIERDIAHKEDLSNLGDRLGSLINENAGKILDAMKHLATKRDLEEQFEEYLSQQKQINELRDVFKAKFPDAHFTYDV